MDAPETSRRDIRPPSGFEDHLSRRQVAQALGFGSEFKVRQLEKEGRLHPIRGAMGSAWYPRAQVEVVRRSLPRPPAAPGRHPRWTDAALIALLRERPRTVVDLVVDAGIPISRAERVYRWWRVHDLPRNPEGVPNLPRRIPLGEAQLHPRDRPAAPSGTATDATDAAERRSGERLEHDALVRQLRDADPKVRAEAFEQLKARR